MIKFKTVKWKNLLATGNYWTEISLDQKLTLIMGENGSGKSTFLEALTFALFNKPFRKTNKPLLVNSINQKDCLVEVEFRTNGRDYRIVRGIKPNIFEIYMDGVMINKESSSRDYQEYLEKFILKMNYKSFTQIVILGAASFTPFMQLPAADRRTIIEDLLDIQIFSVMSTLAKQRLVDLKIKIEENKKDILSKNEIKAFFEEEIKKRQTNNTNKIQKLKIQKQKYEALANTLESEIRMMMEDREDLVLKTDKLSDLQNRHSKLIALQSRIDTKLKTEKKAVSFYNTNESCPTCKQPIDEDFRAEAISSCEKQIESYKTGLNEITEEIKNVVSSINEIREILKNIQQLDTGIASKKAKITSIKTMIESLDENIQEMQNEDQSNQDMQNNLAKVISVIQALEQDKSKLLMDRQYTEVAITLLKDGGIKSKIIKQYLPIINQMINKYLAQMNFLVEFYLNENFEESIRSRFRDEFIYENFSQGEKIKIDVSLMLAWRAIAKMKNSADTNILIMDEIFDSSLDANSADALMAILNSISAETNVFVISHRGDVLRDKFINSLTFIKKKNFSYLK